MAEFRRAYVYLICAISLVIVAVGLVNLLEISVTHLWNFISGSSLFEEPGTEIRRRLSLNLALVGVSLPLLIFHAYLAERWSREDEEGSERGSLLRALFFAAVLTVSLFVFGSSLTAILQTGIDRLVGVSVFVTARDGIVAASTIFVAGAIWVTHAWLRHRDLSLVELPQRGAWPVRAYLYGAMFIGAMMLLTGVAELLAGVLDELYMGRMRFFEFDWLDYRAAPPVSRIVVGALVWGIHWTYALGLLRRNDWAGRAESRSTLRRTYLFGLLFIAIVVTLSATVGLLSEFFKSLFDMRRPDVSAMITPVAIGLSFGMSWAFHRGRTSFELGAFDGLEGPSSVDRLYRYMLAFAGLVMGSIGLGYLAGVTLEFMFQAVDISEGGTIWAESEASVFVAMVAVGAAVWAPYWLSIQRLAATVPQEERVSSSRRAYLYLVLAFGTLALLASVATLIYQFLQVVMGVSTLSGVLSDLPILLGVIGIAAITVGYHLRCLMTDIQYVSGISARVVETQAPVRHLTRSTLVLESSEPKLLRETVARIQESLPDGVRLISLADESITSEPGSPDDPVRDQRRSGPSLPDAPPILPGAGK